MTTFQERLILEATELIKVQDLTFYEAFTFLVESHKAASLFDINLSLNEDSYIGQSLELIRMKIKEL